MRQLASIILVLLLVGLPSCKFFKEKLFGKKARTLAEMQARADSIRVADSLKKIQEHMISLENARLDSIRRAEEAKLDMSSRYNIIVGSFITPEYAQDLAKEYNEMGYNTKIIKLENSKFELVAAEGHENFSTAAKRLTAFQDTVQVESWLYVSR